MASGDEDLAAEFDGHRARLLGVAYRLTGGRADAEDAVQEAWLRLARLDDPSRAGIRELGGWLTTVVGRLCLDRMRSAAARREHYVGPWLPEPIVTSVQPPGTPDPLDAVVQRDDMRMAAVRILHELTADQRLALVLHDGFEVPFTEIAGILGCTAAAARQHASRARRAMSDADPPARVPMPEQQRVLDEFLAAVSSRDLHAVTRVLHPDVSLYGDSDGKARTARQPVTGQDKVARFVLGLVRKYGDTLLDVRPVLVNGDLGVFLPGSPDETPASRRVAPRIMTFAVRGGRTVELHDIVNPDKLGNVRFR